MGNPSKNFRTREKVRQAVEKARKILTADKEAGINIEVLMEDEDLVDNITREDFDKIIAD